jgi:hypothetical protein
MNHLHLLYIKGKCWMQNRRRIRRPTGRRSQHPSWRSTQRIPAYSVHTTRNVGTISNANIIGQAKILSPAPYRSSGPDVDSSVRGHGFVEGDRGRLGEVVIHTFMSTARLTCSSCLENGRQQGRRSPTTPGLDVLQRAQN